MKIWIDGVSREATPEEIAEIEAMAAEQFVPEPTAEERRVIKFLVIQIRLGRITLEQVPEKWRARVEEVLNEP